MRGLTRTRRLKFDHPGLETIAMRSEIAARHPERYRHHRCPCANRRRRRPTVTITHTDVHRARAKFFVELFDDFR